MKDFSDWRRKQVGTGHSLGWVAGTHVQDNGADRHPHIHLVVMKRDEAGKAVDWSVSCLKGRHGKTDPDPMKELKRVFGKNVEKHLEQMVGKENVPSQEQNHSPAPSSKPEIRLPQISPSLRSVARAVWAMDEVMRSALPHRPPELGDLVAREIGAILRIAAFVGKKMEYAREKRRRACLAVATERRREEAQAGKSLGFEPDLPAKAKQHQAQPGEKPLRQAKDLSNEKSRGKGDPPEKENLFQKFIRERTGYIPPRSPDHGPEMEPDF